MDRDCDRERNRSGDSRCCAQAVNRSEQVSALGAASMSAGYRAVLWNRQKRIYDGVLASGIVLYLVLFVGLAAIVHPNATAETLLIRGLGTCAFLMLHIVLAIGPLARLDPRFLPLLYNRRHFGVATFLVGLCHGTFALVQFHALGDTPAFISLVTSNTRYASVSQFPFQVLGAIPLAILFVMAATSHDFWLHNLTPRVWKRLHMMVYFAYALLIAHVSLGALQSERSPWLAGVVIAGALILALLHVAAGFREIRRDRHGPGPAPELVPVCRVNDIPEKRAFVACIGRERIAVFRYDGKISAVSNVCRHQGGPLGEGKVIDGCITCPWHGYQYQPETGASPPPYTDKVETFDVLVRDGKVLVNPMPHPPGTRVRPAELANAVGLRR
jgi:nitrite reductase/ring-hydroxylating ferredoxin subunit/DMSO/TMAO reductase YedYZ heme-binding membrane subunit